jgi:hypothetical protein
MQCHYSQASLQGDEVSKSTFAIKWFKRDYNESDRLKSEEIARLNQENQNQDQELRHLRKERCLFEDRLDAKKESAETWMKLYMSLEHENSRLANETLISTRRAEELQINTDREKNEMASKLMATHAAIERATIDESELKKTYIGLCHQVTQCVKCLAFELENTAPNYDVRITSVLWQLIFLSSKDYFSSVMARFSLSEPQSESPNNSMDLEYIVFRKIEKLRKRDHKSSTIFSKIGPRYTNEQSKLIGKLHATNLYT